MKYSTSIGVSEQYGQLCDHIFYRRDWGYKKLMGFKVDLITKIKVNPWSIILVENGQQTPSVR